MSKGNSGVEYLISVADSASTGSAVHKVALSALGEAGGAAARDYLIGVAKSAAGGSAVQKEALEALGRASRE